MLTLPINPAENASPEALLAFLSQCRDMARSDGRARLVSISIKVPALDPLAVLESIYEAGELHFYAERPSDLTAIAGAEAVLTHECAGADRFASAKAFVDDVFDRTVAVGAVDAPFGGPHVFAGFAFQDEVADGEPFPAARLFVPRWQVARAGDTTTAVANLLVAPDAELAALAERVWRAHAKFGNVRYRETPVMESAPLAFTANEVGDYRASVAQALTEIGRGDFQKIVLARALGLTANQPLHPLRVLNGLRERFPECTSFSFADAHGRSFIGASPERLLRVSRGVLETEALAGSTRRGQGAAEDAALGAALLGSEKDRREQRHVLDSIIRRLTPLGVRPEFGDEPGLKKLANVQHLHTPVKAALPAGIHFLDALAALHPTPAVGGSPRGVAVARIRSLEGFDRGLYAGAIGWLNARGGGEFLVGLRSGLVEGEHARLYAGAGIVAGSDPEREFAETDLKFRAMREALGG
ncbi:MAG: isochorismate synthase [Verrucomicrobiota bacterium]